MVIKLFVNLSSITSERVYSSNPLQTPPTLMDQQNYLRQLHQVVRKNC